MALPEVSTVFVVRSGRSGLEVLLGDVLAGRERGRVAGITGALETEEQPSDAALRAVRDVVGAEAEASALREAGVVDHHFPTRRAWSQRATVFVCRRLTGTPTGSDGFSPRWFPLAEVPYGRMRADAARWLPGVLRGGSVDTRFTFGADLSTIVLEAR
ncbi:NUDIX domain-containing protein [Microbacterium sp. HJ5]